MFEKPLSYLDKLKPFNIIENKLNYSIRCRHSIYPSSPISWSVTPDARIYIYKSLFHFPRATLHSGSVLTTTQLKILIRKVETLTFSLCLNKSYFALNYRTTYCVIFTLFCFDLIYFSLPVNMSSPSYFTWLYLLFLFLLLILSKPCLSFFLIYTLLHVLFICFCLLIWDSFPWQSCFEQPGSLLRLTADGSTR